MQRPCLHACTHARVGSCMQGPAVTHTSSGLSLSDMSAPSPCFMLMLAITSCRILRRWAWRAAKAGAVGAQEAGGRRPAPIEARAAQRALLQKPLPQRAGHRRAAAAPL